MGPEIRCVSFSFESRIANKSSRGIAHYIDHQPRAKKINSNRKVVEQQIKTQYFRIIYSCHLDTTFTNMYLPFTQCNERTNRKRKTKCITTCKFSKLQISEFVWRAKIFENPFGTNQILNESHV